jgi:NAD(P)-dependent dehydrogenase (short-subunit alcohol dehydrogenase family)
MGVEEFNTENVIKMSAEDYPIGRIGEPIECAKAVAFLASDDASFVSGVSLLVCGASFYANIRM